MEVMIVVVMVVQNRGADRDRVSVARATRGTLGSHIGVGACGCRHGGLCEACSNLAVPI